MIEAESLKMLMSRAGRLLSRRAHSRGELRQKLARYADEHQVEAVLDHLEELKLLNDADYAYNFALCRMKQDGWGPLKVLHSLQQRRISMNLAEAMIERVRQETDERSLLWSYLEKHCRKGGLPEDRRGIQKLVCHLRRRGFQDPIIFGALRQQIPAAAWQRLDIGD